MPSSPVWLFDLDNTLHNASHAIFPAVNVNMNRYIARVLAQQGLPFDDEAVNRLRMEYWQRYGATMVGMVRHHGVDAAHFLQEAHTFEDMAAMVRAERGLLRQLKRLPGRKILLTNAPEKYAHALLHELGIHHHFDRHIAVEQMRVHGRMRLKPSRPYLKKLLAHERIPARRAILVEDTLANLKAARAVGVRTVWLTQFLMPSHKPGRRSSYVDVKVKSVRRLTGALARLGHRAGAA